MSALSWIPPLVLMREYEGNWDKYLAAVYDHFLSDFVKSNASFKGTSVRIKKHPQTLGKEATFWHLVSEGKVEDDRTPDIRRCERIRWPKAMMINYGDATVKCWRNNRRGESRICIWLESLEYLLVLAERSDYILLWTAYLVDRNHRKRKLQQEFETNGPL